MRTIERDTKTGYLKFQQVKSIWLLAFLSGIIFFGCQEKIDWELEPANELRLVVNGKITNEKKAHEVKLTLPAFEMNASTEPVSGARVFISDGDGVVELTEDPGRPGIYLTPSDARAVINKIYYLLIRVQNHEFTAATSMNAVTPIKPLQYTRVSEDPALYELHFWGSDEPSMLKYEMDWSHLPGYDTLPDERNHAIIFGYYFSPLSFDTNEIFSPSRDRVFIPAGTRVIITKESLSAGYEQYLRGLLSETSWNGGLFDVTPGNPYTNLSSGAVGYFAATTVTRDTVIFDPE